MPKQDLGELLKEALDAIDESGGEERHLLAQTIGRDVYDKLISKPRTENLIHRWLNATGRAKRPATKALAIAIARLEDTPEKVSRIENELADSFDLHEKPSRPPAGQVKNHAVNQKRNGQRSGYQAPKRVSPSLLADLAKSDDASRYIKARQGKGAEQMATGMISFSATRTGSGDSSTIIITSGDTTNAKSWTTGSFKPTPESNSKQSKKQMERISPPDAGSFKRGRTHERALEHSDAKSAAKQSTYNRVPGRDCHDESEKRVATSREGAKSKSGKRAK